MSKLFSTGDVARRLGWSIVKVRTLIEVGRLPAINSSSGKRPRWHVRECDLDAFLTPTNSHAGNRQSGPTSPHDDRFVRRVMHLWSRARNHGFKIPLALFSSDSWWLSQEPHYLAALHDELFSRRDATFDEIEAEEPPQAFRELYAGNLAFLQSFHSKGSE